MKSRLKSSAYDGPVEQTDPRTTAAWRQLVTDLGPRYSPEAVKPGSYRRYAGEAQNEAVAKVSAFLEALPTNLETGVNLILYGSVGTGKDHMLAAALYKAALAGERCRWCNGLDLFGSMRDRMETAQTEESWIRQWAEPRVLGLSDPLPPAGELSPWRLELLYRLVDRRYRMRRPVWLTVNVQSPDEADRMLSQQVYDRLQEQAVLVRCFWQSWRARAVS